MANKRIISDKMITFLETNYPDVCERRKKENESWENAIGVIIVTQDKMLDEAQNIVKQMEANITALTSDEEDEGRP